MHGCCGDHQPPPFAFQGTNTFPSDQPVLALAQALGLHVPLLQWLLLGRNSRRCHVIKTTDVQAGGQGLLIPFSLPKQTAQLGQGSPATRERVAVLRVNETFAPCSVSFFVSHWGSGPALLLFMLHLGVVRRCRPCVAVSGLGIQRCRTCL